MRQDMPLQVVRFNQRDAERSGQAFRKGHTDEQTTHQARAQGHGNGRNRFFIYTCLSQSLIYDRHDVLLVCARRQFGDDAPISLVHSLARRHVAQEIAILNHSCRRVVAA